MDELEPTAAESEQLKTILREHDAEFCKNCGHEIGFGDIAWNEADTESGTPYSVFHIQCVICQTEIAHLHSWYPGVSSIEILLREIDGHWK